MLIGDKGKFMCSQQFFSSILVSSIFQTSRTRLSSSRTCWACVEWMTSHTTTWTNRTWRKKKRKWWNSYNNSHWNSIQKSVLTTTGLELKNGTIVWLLARCPSHRVLLWRGFVLVPIIVRYYETMLVFQLNGISFGIDTTQMKNHAAATEDELSSLLTLSVSTL